MALHIALATRCPHCETVFKLDPHLLAPHDGRMRCGHCQEVFDAAHHRFELTDDDDPTKPSTLRSSTTIWPSARHRCPYRKPSRCRKSRKSQRLARSTSARNWAINGPRRLRPSPARRRERPHALRGCIDAETSRQRTHGSARNQSREAVRAREPSTRRRTASVANARATAAASGRAPRDEAPPFIDPVDDRAEPFIGPGRRTGEPRPPPAPAWHDPDHEDEPGFGTEPAGAGIRRAPTKPTCLITSRTR